MVNQWGRDGNVASSGSRSAGSIIIPVLVALVIGGAGGYAGGRFLTGSAGEIEAKDRTIAELQTNLTKLQAGTEGASSEKSTLQRRLDELQDQAAALTRTRDSLRDRIAALEPALAKAKAQAADAADLKGRIADLNEQLSRKVDSADAEARKQITVLAKEKALLEARLQDALKSRVDSDDQTKKLTDLRKELDVMAESLAERDDAARKALEDRDIARTALAKLQKQIERIKDVNTDLTASNEALQKQLDGLKTTIARLKDKPVVPDDTPAQPADNETSAGPKPRDRQAVENAVADLPGFQSLTPAKQTILVKKLQDGACVTEALKAAYGRVSPLSLRNLLRDLGGQC